MANRSLKGGLSDQDRKKKKISDLYFNMKLSVGLCTYLGAVIGGCAARTETQTLMEAIEYFNANTQQAMFALFPTVWIYPVVGLMIGILYASYLYSKVMPSIDVVEAPHGDAAFETNYEQYNREFVYDPNIIKKVKSGNVKGYYNNDDGHKFVVSEKIPKNIHDACWQNTQIYSEKVALSLNGKWTQRNTNAVIFGASGAGKSRFFLSPNLLQANSSYVITDPSGDVMQGFGAFLKERGYIVRCLNVSNMTKSCRFNPLHYMRKQSDIPLIANALMENTRPSGQKSGDPFWDKATLALLSAIFGYLLEVEPEEKRNFYNVLNFLLKAPQDENADETVATEFDQMFELLGKKNPNSYAYQQYRTFRTAPTKTALSVLISTTVLFSTYLVDDFNNLTYKDEMDLDKIGVAPFLDKSGRPMEKVLLDQYGNPMMEIVTDINGQPIKEGNQIKMQPRTVPYTLQEIMCDETLREQLQLNKKGVPVEGEPYKMALFLCIPQGDTTYNWLVGMLYSVLFNKIYTAGEQRQADMHLSNPELAYPVRFLIDECANIGKIPNLSERLATCRKYRLSVVPIFQNYAQITKVYGKEDANSIISNCDTTLFLGGADPETLKIVTGHLGKETIKTRTNGVSKAAKSNSYSTNYGIQGRDLMTAYQVEQMKNSECLVFIRSVRPFKDKKYPLQNHPNYGKTAEKEPEKYSFINPFVLEYNDEEIEAIRIKSVDEDGFIEPKEVSSARSRAAKREREKLRNNALEELENTLREKQEEIKKNENLRMRATTKNEFAKAKAYLLNIYQEAEADQDLACIQAIVAMNERYEMLDLFDTNDKKEKKAEADMEEGERQERLMRARRAKNIMMAQNGQELPSPDPDDYTFISSHNALAEFEGTVIPDRELEIYKAFYQKTAETIKETEKKQVETEKADITKKVDVGEEAPVVKKEVAEQNDEISEQKTEVPDVEVASDEKTAEQKVPEQITSLVVSVDDTEVLEEKEKEHEAIDKETTETKPIEEPCDISDDAVANAAEDLAFDDDIPLENIEEQLEQEVVETENADIKRVEDEIDLEVPEIKETIKADKDKEDTTDDMVDDFLEPDFSDFESQDYQEDE